MSTRTSVRRSRASPPDSQIPRGGGGLKGVACPYVGHRLGFQADGIETAGEGLMRLCEQGAEHEKALNKIKSAREYEARKEEYAKHVRTCDLCMAREAVEDPKFKAEVEAFRARRAPSA